MRSIHNGTCSLIPSPRTLAALELRKFNRRVRASARQRTMLANSRTCWEIRSSDNRRSNHEVIEAPSRTSMVAATIPANANLETLTAQESGGISAAVKEVALIAV